MHRKVAGEFLHDASEHAVVKPTMKLGIEVPQHLRCRGPNI